MLAGFSVILLPIAISQKKIGRLEGLVLFIAYAAYIAWRTLMPAFH